MFPCPTPWGPLTAGRVRVASRRRKQRRLKLRWALRVVELQLGVLSFLSLAEPQLPAALLWRPPPALSQAQQRALDMFLADAATVCRAPFVGLAAGRVDLATALAQSSPEAGYGAAPEFLETFPALRPSTKEQSPAYFYIYTCS